jgi:zinc protease
LWTVSLIHDSNVKPEQILAAADTVIDQLASQPVDQKLLDRSITKLRSNLYDSMTSLGGFGRANLLASFALFDDNPARINSLEAEFRNVTPQLIQKTAQEYLRKTNRTVLTLEAGAAKPGSTKPTSTKSASGGDR